MKIAIFVLFVKTIQKSYTCFGSVKMPFPAGEKTKTSIEMGVLCVCLFAGEERRVLCFFVFLFVSREMERRAHRLNYKIEESEGEGNENRCFGGACRAGEVADDNGEIKHDKYKVNGKLCKVRFDKFYIEHEIAQRINRREKENMPKVFRFENFVAAGVHYGDKGIEHHNDEREVKAHMTEKAFYL